MEMAKYSADDFKACTVTVRKSSHKLKFRNGLYYCFDVSFFHKLILRNLAQRHRQRLIHQQRVTMADFKKVF